MITLNPNNTIYEIYNQYRTLEGRVTSVDNLVTFLHGMYREEKGHEPTRYTIKSPYIDKDSDAAFIEFIKKHDGDFEVFVEGKASVYFYIKKKSLSDLSVDM